MFLHVGKQWLCDLSWAIAECGHGAGYLRRWWWCISCGWFLIEFTVCDMTDTAETLGLAEVLLPMPDVRDTWENSD